MIKLKNVTKQYGKLKAIDSLDLEFYGGVLGVAGPNGSGKSTLFRMLTGLAKPTTGEIRVFSKDPLKERNRIFDRLSFAGENTSFPAQYSVEEIIKSMHRIRGIYDIDFSVVDQLRLPKDKLISELSSGMEQKLALSVSLIGDPKLVILDEPTASLDPLSRYEIFNIIKRKQSTGISFLFSSHNLNEIEKLCDHILLLNNGQKFVYDTLESFYKKNRKNSSYIIKCSDPAYLHSRMNDVINLEDSSIHNSSLRFQSKLDSTTLMVELSSIVLETNIKIFSFSNESNVENFFLEKQKEEKIG